jgi:DNA ligase (NAD+)
MGDCIIEPTKTNNLMDYKMNRLIETPVQDLSNDELSQLVDHLHTQYEIGSPMVTDDVFDFIYIPALQARLPNHPALTKVRPQPLTAKGRIAHPSPMLSTDKAYTTKDVRKWLDRVIKHGAALGIKASDIIIETSSKLDGIAGRRIQSTNQIVTRGDGSFGSDISHLSSAGLVIVGDDSQDAIGEIVMKNGNFDANFSVEALGEEDGYIDSRGFIAGMANADNIKELPRQALEKGFVELVIYADMPRTPCSADLFMDTYESLEEIHLRSDYMLDGVIYDVMNIQLRESLGNTSHHPVWRLAKKKIEGAKAVTSHNIRWQVGRTGKITPVMEIPPTLLPKVSVTSITGHSLGYIKKHGLGVGATFLAHRAGSVIPAWLETLERVEPSYPLSCPRCETETVIRMGIDKDNEPCEYLYCSNDECGGSTVSSLFHAFKCLGIDLFGKKGCEKLVDNKITTLEQIFQMTDSDFQVVGFGAGQSANFIAEIARGKKEPLKDSHLIAALGIHTLGRENAEKILKHYKISTLESLTYEELFALDGFADISTKAIITGLSDKRETLAFLLNQNFNLTHTSEQVTVTNTDSGLSGLNVVFTGTMVQGNRSDMTVKAILNGASVQKKVTKKTNILIFGSKVGATKIDAAKELGVETITEQEYIDRFGA